MDADGPNICCCPEDLLNPIMVVSPVKYSQWFRIMMMMLSNKIWLGLVQMRLLIVVFAIVYIPINGIWAFRSSKFYMRIGWILAMGIMRIIACLSIISVGKQPRMTEVFKNFYYPTWMQSTARSFSTIRPLKEQTNGIQHPMIRAKIMNLPDFFTIPYFS